MRFVAGFLFWRSAFAAPPAFPALEGETDLTGASSIAPVAILATMMAAPITSAGRFSPLGPWGFGYSPCG